MTIKNFFRLLFRSGIKGVAYSHHCERELTPEEVKEIEQWMAGVDKAFDGLSEQMSKMPKFAAKTEKANG